MGRPSDGGAFSGTASGVCSRCCSNGFSVALIGVPATIPEEPASHSKEVARFSD